jgi:Subtilase family
LRRLYLHRSSPIILLLILFICGAAYASQYSIGENGSNAQAVHQLGYTGVGINIGLISFRNVRNTHQAFNDSNGTHVFNFDYSGSGVDYTGGPVPGHDTWVAGIIASRGWMGHPNDIGVSPDCNIYSARVVDNNNSIGNDTNDFIEDALNALIKSHNCKVIVTPIQLSGTANGSSLYSLMFDYFAYTNNVVFALASGNDTINPTIFGDAYNGITTAALIDEPNDFYLQVGNSSNPGPTIDGRKKPEISCPGSSQTTPSIGSDTDYYTTVKDGATSFAIPQTAGVAALLLQYANSTSEPADGHSEVIKAVIVNSTFPNIKDKTGNPTNPADPNNTWQHDRGYGRIDALRAYQTLSSAKVSKSTTITSSVGWAYDTMSFSATHTYIIRGKKNKRLISTVTWNRQARKSGSTYLDETSPKFNIDVNVYNPSGGTIFSETSNKDNLEKIDLLLPADGNYTVSLHNTTTKSRAYGLAFELLEPITGDFNIDYVVDEKDLNRMAIEWLTAGPDTDIVHDSNNIVNYLDFAAFADNWLKIDKRYYNP